MDVDLQSMTLKELQDEVMKLRLGIRKHRDQKGDENCWLDDQFYLYGMLPEKLKVDQELPPKPLMMLNCSRYYDCRKAGKEYVPLDTLPKKFVPTGWISVKDKIPPYDTRVVVMNLDNLKQCIAYNECYDELAMTRVDTSNEVYQKVPFEITHWCLIPEEPYEEKQ
jgi:hypothetical protein